ncbi:hypothetical protein [Halomarina litorea]|uniref:hypothetical protein n=1 Tax=Halomarina litorea TaxID=2961595 RepID=UPI0020C49958|nr:hypothetical protein [Halomarina sp. BCD28]
MTSEQEGGGSDETRARTAVDVEMSGDDPSSIGTENTMRERAGESRLKLWVLLKANRLVLTGVLASLMFVAFVVSGAVLFPPFRQTAITTDVLDTIFTTMTSAVLTGVTLIVSINQLVISQENGPLGDQRQRMSATLDYRDYASELLGTTTPADPSMFLRALVSATGQRARTFRESIEDSDNEDLKEEVDAFVDSLIENAEEVRDELDGATFGTFDVLFAALNYNYAWKIFQTDRISDEYDSALSDEQQGDLYQLRSSLAMFGPAREHIKTLYFQWALTSLSQLIIYAALPALVVSGIMMSFVDGTTFTGSTLGISDILWVTAGALTLTLVPFLLFVSYISRIATVAKRTLAIGPLILRDSQR